jgi:hypothetical protein
MSYTDLRFAGFNRSAWDPSWSPNFSGNNAPQTSAGTLERGPFTEGLSRFVPNALGKKALDAVKTGTGIDLNVQYQPSNLEDAAGFYAGKQPGEAPNVRTINFTSSTPTLGVLLHEAGHAVDPSQDQRNPIIPSEFNALKTPAERLDYIWNRDAQLQQDPWTPPTNTGFSTVKAETEAQRFAKEYLGKVSPAAGQKFTKDPWFKGYPLTYGDQTIQAVYNAELPMTFPTHKNLAGTDLQFVDDSTIVAPNNTYNALKMALDPKFQKIQSGILNQSRDYVNNVLQ